MASQVRPSQRRGEPDSGHCKSQGMAAYYPAQVQPGRPVGDPRGTAGTARLRVALSNGDSDGLQSRVWSSVPALGNVASIDVADVSFFKNLL